MFAILGLIPGFGAIASVAGAVISFILSCRPCLIALAILAAFIWGDIHGNASRAKKCRADDLAAQLAAVKRDNDAKAETIRFNENQVKDLQGESGRLRAERDEYAHLSKTGSCAIGDDRARRLRGIAR